MALVRWEPVRELTSLQSEMNRLFNTFFDTPTAGNGAPRAAGSPPMDLVEHEDHFVLRADLPGLTQEDSPSSSQDDVLTISGERKAAHEAGRLRLLPARARHRRLQPHADAPGRHRRRRRRGVVRQGRPRGPHPEARAAQAAPRQHQRGRAARDDRGPGGRAAARQPAGDAA